MIEMLALHMKHAGMGHGVEPLTHHVMNVTTRIPIPLIAVVRAKDDEEGDGGDEDSHAVGVLDVSFIGGEVRAIVEFEEDVDEYGDYTGNRCTIDW